jgi:hypothetical protein
MPLPATSLQTATGANSKLRVKVTGFAFSGQASTGTTLHTGTSYPLEVTASGHAVTDLDVYLDGTDLDHRIVHVHQSCAQSQDSCSIIRAVDLDPVTQGKHTITATGTNDFERTSPPAPLDLWVDYPWFCEA